MRRTQTVVAGYRHGKRGGGVGSRRGVQVERDRHIGGSGRRLERARSDRDIADGAAGVDAAVGIESRPALYVFASRGGQIARIIHLKRAIARVERVAIGVLGDEEPAALNRRVKWAGFGLNCALRKVLDTERLGRSESNLGSSVIADGLRDQVAERHVAALETGRIHVGQVVARHVDRGGSSVERGKRG